MSTKMPALGENQVDLPGLIASVRDSGRRLLVVMEDMLDLANLQNGINLGVSRVFHLREEIENLLVAANIPPDSDLWIDPRCDAMFDAHPQAWRRVVTHMIGYMMSRAKAAEAQNLPPSKLSIRVSVGENGHGVLVEMDDSGPKVTANQTRTLFKSLSDFTPEAAAQTTLETSWGIALGLSRSLAREMSGELAAAANADGGLILRFYVPMERMATIGSVDNVEEISDAPSNLRLLVAEDNEANQRIISIVLEQLGHQCTLAHNGQEAVTAASNDAFDLIIMDLHMPIMDGYTATRLIKANPISANTPIVALTADARPEAAMEALDAGMDDVLLKPIQVAQLAQLLSRIEAAGPIAAQQQAFG